MFYRYKKQPFVSCAGKRSGTGTSVVGVASEADKTSLEKAGSLNDGRSHEMGPISLLKPIYYHFNSCLASTVFQRPSTDPVNIMQDNL